MAENGFVKWLSAKVTPRPIAQIEQTLNTGKPPSAKPQAASPVAVPKRPAPANPAARMKAALTKTGGKP